METRKRIAGLLTVTLLLPCAAAAQSEKQTRLDVPSLNIQDDAFLQGSTADAMEVTLAGRLSLPGGDGPFPVVILLHGSGGPSGPLMPTWSSSLNEDGIGAFALDSHSGRDLTEIYSDQGKLGIFSSIYDLYRAVEVVAAAPNVDPNRIVVMGLSRGGVGALYSAMVRFQEVYGPKRGRLVAHIPFYPPCNFELKGDTEVGTAPIRLFHGGADDWNLADACRIYVARLKLEGRDVEMTEYPDARHAFDFTGSPAYNVVEDAQTSRNCLRRERAGRLVNAVTGERFSWSDACVERGPAMQYDRAAATAARLALSEFLRRVFSEH